MGLEKFVLGLYYRADYSPIVGLKAHEKKKQAGQKMWKTCRYFPFEGFVVLAIIYVTKILFFVCVCVPVGSPSRGGDVTVYV